MNICDLINELETIKDQYGEDVEIAVQDRINKEGADPFLNFTYSEKEFLTYNSGNYYVEKVLLL